MKTIKLTYRNDALAAQASEAVIKQYPRKRNISPAQPSVFDRRLGYKEDEKFNYKGKFKGYRGSNFVPRYTSRLVVRDKYRANYEFGFWSCDKLGRTTGINIQSLRAPAGTEWDRDGSLVMSSDYHVEYHPTLDDLLARDFGRRAIAGLRKARVRRTETLRMQAEYIRYQQIMERETPTVRVTLDDSRRAGNCVEGTLRYAETRLSIPREMVLSAPWLVGVSASRLDDSAPCRRAITQAFARETTVSI